MREIPFHCPSPPSLFLALAHSLSTSSTLSLLLGLIRAEKSIGHTTNPCVSSSISSFGRTSNAHNNLDISRTKPLSATCMHTGSYAAAEVATFVDIRIIGPLLLSIRIIGPHLLRFGYHLRSEKDRIGEGRDSVLDPYGLPTN